jgi:hypothetical protein
MNDDPRVYFFGAFVYCSEPAAGIPELVRALILDLLADLGLAEEDVKIAQYTFGGKQGGWRVFRWDRVDEALGDSDVGAIDVLHGTSRPPHVKMTMNLQIRANPALEIRVGPPIGPPRMLSFLCEATAETDAHVVRASRHVLETCAMSKLSPISGGVFRAPHFNEAHKEIGGGYDAPLPQDFVDRIRFDRKHETKTRALARRLYPITLLGPTLASQVSTDALRAAGAAAVDELNGSLVIEAPGDVVETWAPSFLARTTELRRLLRPLTINNPADASGLD